MNWFRFRASLVFFALFAGLILVLLRAIQIQSYPDSRLVQFVENKNKWNRKKSETEHLKSRGNIVDRRGQVLALSLISKSFFANPRLIDQPKTVAHKLARRLNMKTQEVENLLSQDRFFVWIKREVDYETAREVEALEIPGLHASKESRRISPHGELGRTVVGLAGRDGVGLEGVEKVYDSWLKIEDESENWGLRDALGRGLRFQDYDQQWFEAHDVVLTLDLRLQKIMEDALRSVVKKENALHAQAVMMDPFSGEILAMASVDGERQPQKTFFRNRTLSDVFEPGSTFKLVVAMAGLEKLHLSPSSQIYGEKGVLQIGPNRVREYNARKFDWLTLTEMLAKSSNVAAAKLGLKMGADHLYDTIERFGFGAQTGIDLPGEAEGLLRSPSSWRPIDLANISFGQGIAVTGLQMARAFAAVANGGFLVKPYVVEKVVEQSQNDRVIWQSTKQRHEVFQAEHARALREMLLSVTEEEGTGQAAAIAGFRVAGKTGTSQKLVERENSQGRKYKAYSSETSIVSFGGFVPAEDPAFVLFVMVDEPEGRASGGSVAAPLWAEIAKKSLGVLGRGQSVARSATSLSSPSSDSLFVGKSFQKVLSEVRAWEQAERRKVELIGFGQAVREEISDEKIKVFFE